VTGVQTCALPISPQFVVVPYPIPKKCVATYFPEANVLIPIESVAEKSNTPTSKSVIVTLHTREGGKKQEPLYMDQDR
jgi:hypothetical protein